MSKGSKRRPQKVSQQQFNSNWDKVFVHKNYELAGISERISQYTSDNGRITAVVVSTERGYVVEIYKMSRYITKLDCTGHSLQYAEDAAENVALGIHPLYDTL